MTLTPALEEHEIQVADLHVAAIWEQFESVMTNRGLTRLAGASVWTWLAVESSDSYFWLAGATMLIGALLSILHARRRLMALLLQRAASRSRGLKRTLDRCFPFPAEPHVGDLSGWVESLGLLGMAASTGWILDAFAEPVVEVGAATAVLLTGSTYFANLAAHPTYSMISDPSRFRILQYLSVALAAVASIGLLWPADGSADQQSLVVMGSLVMVGSGVRWAVHAENQRLSTDRIIMFSQAAALRNTSLNMHSDLKNPAMIMLDTSQDLDLAARELARAELAGDEVSVARWERMRDEAWFNLSRNAVFVATRISQYVESTRAQKSRISKSATDVVEGLLRCQPTWVVERYRDVVSEEIDPSTLTPIDNNLLTSCVSELLTNAIRADASEIRVAFRRRPLSLESPGVELVVRCRCGRAVQPGRPTSGTLALLAERLEFYGGSLAVVDHGDGSHDSIARWPVAMRY